MLLQNTLDLSTFEIVRFRIWNQTSQPSDRGFGSKYFNTNSGHEAYCREEIFTPSGWRTAAYLDDIEALTNGEGSLGTRVKALEDMLGLQDVTDVIDTWNDVKEFFANVDEGLDLMTMLDGKLDKTGGTVTGNLFVKNTSWGAQLRVYGDNTQAGIEFYHDDTKIGNLVTYAPDKLAWYDNVSRVAHVLIHAGNVGDYALKVDGSNRMKAGIDWNDAEVGVNVDDLGTGLIVGKTTQDGSSLASYGYKYASVLNVSDEAYRFQIASSATGGNKLFYRGYNANTSSFDDWKTIAFTDSVLLLDGSNTMTGNLKMTEDKAILWGSANLLQYTTSKFIIGRSASIDERPTEIHGYPIIFRYGNDEGTAMTITEDGNVNIGTTFKGFKFSVYGGMTFLHGVESSALALGQVPTNGLLVGNTNYGIGQWFQGGQGYIQASSFGNTTATAYALNLNPLGGAVNVGGNLAPNANKAVSLGLSSYRWSDVYSVGGNFSGRVLIGGAQDNTIYTLNVKGATSSQGIYSNFVYIGCGEDGTATGYGGEINRFGGANLYIQNRTPFTSVVFGDMEGTVNAVFRGAIGVAGLASFNGGALIPTGQTLTIGSVTIKEVATGEIEVNGNLHTTGTLASGGKAEEGENTTGNAMVYQYDLASGESVYTVDNVKGSTNVIVQIFEWNSNTSSWDMILTDVSVKADAITVTFGRTTTVNHMVTVC